MRSVFRIAAACAAIAVLPTQSQAGSVDWPSYNRTLLGERFAPLREIDAETVRRLHVICKFDSGEVTGFESGLVEDGGAIYFSSEHDTYSIGANDCRENWRVHEEFNRPTYSGRRAASRISTAGFFGAPMTGACWLT